MNELSTGTGTWLAKMPKDERARILAGVMEVFNREMMASNSPHTIRAYESDVRMFFGVKAAKDVTGEMILGVDYSRVYAYRAELSDRRLSGNTIARRFAFLRNVYDLLAKLRLIPANPFEKKLLKLPNGKKTRIPTTPLTDEEVVRILSAPDRAAWKGSRDFCLMVFALVFGLRREELARIDFKSVIDRGEGLEFQVLTKGGKTRGCHLDAITSEVFRDWAEARGSHKGAVFINRPGSEKGLSPKQIWVIVNEYAVAAGIQRTVKDKKGGNRNAIHPHSFRASNVIGIMEKHGIAAAQGFVQHENSATTLDYSRGKAHDQRKLASTFAPLVQRTKDGE